MGVVHWCGYSVQVGFPVDPMTQESNWKKLNKDIEKVSDALSRLSL